MGAVVHACGAWMARWRQPELRDLSHRQMKAIRTTRHEVAGDLLMAQTAPACYNSRPPKQFTANGGTMRPLRNFALVATLGFSSLAAQTGPPPTPVRDVSDTYFGTTVIDH